MQLLPAQNQSSQQTEATRSRQEGLLSCNSASFIFSDVQENLQQTVNYFSDSSFFFLVLEMQHLGHLLLSVFPGKRVPQRIRKYMCALPWLLGNAANWHLCKLKVCT